MKLLTKAFNILNLFLEHGTEMTLAEIARLSGLNKSTVNRIASTLVKYGYLAQREKRGKYSLGFKYFEFTGLIKRRLKVRDIAVPHLRRLTQMVNESTIFAIWDGEKVAITETFHASHTLRVVPDEGTRIPLHCSSLGKVILAHLSEAEIERLLGNQPLRRYTSRTITDAEMLKAHLAHVARDGIAVDDEEFIENVRSIAAVIRGVGDTVIGGIGIIAPSVRMPHDKMTQLAVPLAKCAMDISLELGYKAEKAEPAPGKEAKEAVKTGKRRKRVKSASRKPAT
ncbi:MAG: IclR family transcriptional regulator [Dehalococcoidales bacterium]|nr:IclR family transcriptional regulator [Dehalococcoidales bacterium]